MKQEKRQIYAAVKTKCTSVMNSKIAAWFLDSGIRLCISATLLLGTWGLASSAILSNYVFNKNSGIWLRTIIGIGIGGLPCAVICVLTSIRSREVTMTGFLLSALGTFVTGIYSAFFGTVLQFLFLMLGIRSILGLRIDLWVWNFPENFGGH